MSLVYHFFGTRCRDTLCKNNNFFNEHICLKSSLSHINCSSFTDCHAYIPKTFLRTIARWLAASTVSSIVTDVGKSSQHGTNCTSSCHGTKSPQFEQAHGRTYVRYVALSLLWIQNGCSRQAAVAVEQRILTGDGRPTKHNLPVNIINYYTHIIHTVSNSNCSASHRNNISQFYLQKPGTK